MRALFLFSLLILAAVCDNKYTYHADGDTGNLESDLATANQAAKDIMNNLAKPFLELLQGLDPGQRAQLDNLKETANEVSGNLKVLTNAVNELTPKVNPAAEARSLESRRYLNWINTIGAKKDVPYQTVLPAEFASDMGTLNARLTAVDSKWSRPISNLKRDRFRNEGSDYMTNHLAVTQSQLDNLSNIIAEMDFDRIKETTDF